MNESNTKSGVEKVPSHFSQFIRDYGICMMYLLALLSILLSSIMKDQHWIMLIPIGMFLYYDIWFRWFRKSNDIWSSHGRTYKETLNSINKASQYTSFFIAFIALSLTISLEKGISDIFHELLSNPFVKAYGLMVLALSGVVLLFIPVPYLAKNEHNTNEPSVALKNCFFCVLLMEKIIILLLVYLIIVITKTALMNAGIQIHPA